MRSLRSCAAFGLLLLVCVSVQSVGVWGATSSSSADGGAAAEGLSSSSASSALGPRPRTCNDAALDYLQQHGVPATTESAARGNGSSVCGGGGGDGGGGCCSSEVTEALVEAGRAALSDVVKHQAHSLHKLLTQHREHLHGVVVSALGSAHQRVSQVFATTYPRLAVSGSKEVLQDLFVGLEVALTDSDDTALNRIMDTFWDDLFPPVYHSALHARLPPFDSSYVECLRDVRRTVSPWGIIPALVGEPLIRGLQTARLLIHALDQGADALAAAQRWRAPRECGEAHARMTLCQACHGAATPTPPCLGLCLNIGRGCLAPLAEVDGAWGDLATAASRAYESLKAADLKHNLRQLPDKLSEAVMVALERGPKLQKKVRRECSSPTHEEHLATHSTPPTAQGEMAVDLTTDSWSVVGVSDAAGSAVRAVEAARGWWAGLADEHCRTTAALDSDICWNGRALHRYSKTLSGVGLALQKYNPEVRVARPDTQVYALADSLRAVKRLVTSRLTWLPQSESYKREDAWEGSGSGTMINSHQPLNSMSDDEDSDTDDYEGSGGSGAGPYGGELPIVPVNKGGNKAAAPDVITDGDKESGDSGAGQLISGIGITLFTLSVGALLKSIQG